MIVSLDPKITKYCLSYGWVTIQKWMNFRKSSKVGGVIGSLELFRKFIRFVIVKRP